MRRTCGLALLAGVAASLPVLLLSAQAGGRERRDPPAAQREISRVAPLRSRTLVIVKLGWVTDEAAAGNAIYVTAQPWRWRPGPVNRMYTGLVTQWRPRPVSGHVATGDENFLSVSSNWVAWTEGGAVASYWRVYV